MVRRSSRIAAQTRSIQVEQPVVASEEAPSLPLPTREPQVIYDEPFPAPVPALPSEKAAPASPGKEAPSKETTSEEPSSSSSSSEEEIYEPPPRKKAPQPRGRGAKTSAPRRFAPTAAPKPYNHGISPQEISYDMEMLEEDGSINLNGRITVTRAKKEYQLNDKDIAHLTFQTRKNPHHPDAYPIRLFSLREIVRTSYMKHGGAAGLEAAQARSQARSENYRIRKMERERGYSD